MNLRRAHVKKEANVNPKDVRRIIVVGAGTMGHGIAQVFAQAGIEVNLVDLKKDILERADRLIRGNLDLLADHDKVIREDIPAILDRIHFSTNLTSAAEQADFALEAVAEVPEVKRDLFQELSKTCPQGTILASNTSSLNVFEIAKIDRPDRLVVAHWFSPPYIIPLVEVVPGPETTMETLSFTTDLMKSIGKRTVTMKQFVPSFIVNRIQSSVLLTVMKILENGWATPEEIDQAIKLSLGIRLPVAGVAQTFDFTGLNLLYDSLRATSKSPAFLEEKVKQGYLGIKTSRGLYDYQSRSEEEIIQKRDALYLKMLDHLDNINAFEPI
jgi:3-hydroxybutyryl-CoA dehydrogenase